MCTFDGIIREYPWISVDCFLPVNCQTSRVFFISHIHTDHLRGLGDSYFANYVQEHRSIRIRCSEATRSFLSQLSAYKHLSRIYSLVHVNQPIAIQHPDDENLCVTVTCIGSGHCPGSLMLLFEGSQGIVLYTGDFRLYNHQSTGYRWPLSKKKIDSLYMDMTFFDPSIRHLPEREHACRTLIQLIEQSPNRQIYLKTSARVGYEYIYTSLSRHFGLPIHVNPEQYRLYSCLPQVQRILTTNSHLSRLHACWPRCSETHPSIKIVLSVLWFTMQQEQRFTSPLIQISSDYYRLCYSLHSSYTEICNLLRKISPNRVHPIALPNQIDLHRFEQLLLPLGIRNQLLQQKSSSKTSEPQIKHRYQLRSRKKYEILSEDHCDLDLDGHDHRLQNEKQLFKRVSDLQQSAPKRMKTNDTSSIVSNFTTINN